MKKALLFIFLLFTLYANAQEGTKQLMPNSNDRLWIEFNVFSGNNFGNYSATEKERINIYMNAGEILHFGMKMNTSENYGQNVITNSSKVSFRIKDPNGAIVFTERTMITSGSGYISSYDQAVTGPNGVILNGTTISGGYNALTYTATSTGNHYIEFNAQKTYIDYYGNSKRFALQYFDVTVTDATNHVKTNPGEPNQSAGRLWSKGWIFTNTSFNLYPVKAEFYVFTSDEFINKVNYEMKPFSFSFVANSYGVSTVTTDNYIQRAQSQENDLTSGDISEYRIYLNDPDRTVWPNTTLAPPKVEVTAEDTLIYDYDYYRSPMLNNIEKNHILLEKNRASCAYESITIFKIEANIDGFVAILIDIDGGGYSTTGNDRVIYRNMKKGLNYILWNFKDDNGDPVSEADYQASATFLGRGPAHFPLYDVESLSGLTTSSVRPFKKLELTNYWDDSQISTWGDDGGSMDETDKVQLIINEDVPRMWSFDSASEYSNHNGNLNTLNSWFHAIDLGLSKMVFRVEQSDSKCVDGTAPYVGDVYKYEDINTTMNFEDSDLSDKFFDPTDMPLNSIQVLSLPDHGTLYLSGSPINVNQIITVANINLITFVPDLDWYGKTQFAWKAYNGTKWSLNQDSIYLVFNTAPTISSMADQTICTNTSLTNMPFSIDDAETPSSLNVIAYSHNPSLVPNSNISIGGSGTNRTISVTPKTNTSGFAIIYVKVDDGLSESIEEFALYVGPDLNFLGDTTVCRDDDLNLVAQEVGATYVWKKDATSLGTSKTLNIGSAAVEAGNYSLTVSKNGCSATRYFTVAVAPLTTFVGDVNVCEGEEISLSATETVAEYIWRKGTNIIDVTKILNISEAKLSDDGNDYTLEVTKEGCNHTSDPFTISVIEKPDLDLVVTGSTVNIGNDGTVTITAAENGVVYTASVNGVFITSATGTGVNLILTIPSEQINIGDNTIIIKADNTNCEVSLNLSANVHVNVLPIANNDSEFVDEDASVNTVVLSNDAGLDDGGIVITITDNPDFGFVVVELDNTISYSPNPEYNGVDSYTYQIKDADGDTDDAVVSITVNPVDDMVNALDDTFSVNEDISLSNSVITNDLNLGDGGILTTLVNNVTHGTLILDLNGTFNYTPDNDYYGSDNFTYQLSDADGDTDDALVTITINAMDDLVDAVDDLFSVDEDGSLLDNVLTNDQNLGDGGISVSKITDVTHGTLTLNADGTFNYTPVANYHGAESFTYKLVDADGDFDNATVSITVNSVNDIVDAIDDIFSVDEDGSLSNSVISNDLNLGDGGITISLFTGVSHGTLSLLADGSFDYMPNADYHGSDSFTYQISDNDGDNDKGAVTITVNSMDDIVDAINDAFSVDEDGTLSGNVITNDLNLGDGGLSISLLDVVSNGILSLNADGTFNYTPNKDFNGTNSFHYRLRDADGDTDDATVTITVNPIDDLVNAINDTFTVNEDATLNGNVISNDLNIGDGGIETTVGTNVTHGTLNLSITGTFTYTPNTDYHGSDSFTYQLIDVDGDTDDATVSITISSVNDTPIANNDVVSTSQDVDIDISILANDTGLGDGVNSLTVTSTPANGSTTINGDNTITYSPNTGYTGNNSFSYEVCDNDGQCASALVTITIDNQDDQPDAVEDNVSVDEDDQVTISVLANDLDLYDGGLIVTITSDPANGNSIVNIDNTITYTPVANYYGSDVLTYQVCDGDGDCSSANVNITVNSVNDIVDAVDDLFSVNEDASLNENVLTNDLNLGDGGIETSIVANVTHGSLSLSSNGTFTYTPDANYYGFDSFTYKLTDANNDTDNATVTLTVNSVNDIVKAIDDVFSLSEDGLLNENVLINDENLGDGGIFVALVNNVAHGTLSLNANGTFTYSPNADYNGSDSFTYQLSDTNGDIDNATVTITVNSVNDVVEAINDLFSVDEDATLNEIVISNDLNLGDGGISVTLVNNVAHGTLILSSDGSFTYSPNADYNGLDSFTYLLTDADNDTDNATVSITVNPVNDNVDAVDDAFSLSEDGTLNNNVISNDLNLGDGGIQTTIFSNVAYGTLTLNLNGTFEYIPNADFNGTDSFTYHLVDVDGDMDDATVDITINPVDDIVDAMNDAFSVNEDEILNENVLTNDLNLGDGGIATTLISGVLHGFLTLNSDGTFTYTPNTDYNGSDSFTYQLHDADGDVNTATVTLTVVAVNDEVDAINDDFSINEDGTLNENVLTNDQNLGDGGIVVTLDLNVSHGTLNLNNDGSFSYNPNSDYYGSDSFTYDLNDTNGDTDKATVTITVNAVDDLVDAINDPFSVNEDATLNDNVTSNDLNLGDGGIVVTLKTDVSHGALTLNSDGTFTYIPTTDYNGPDNFTYQICDVDMDCDIATVSINVFPVNDVVNAINDVFNVNEDETLNNNVITNDLNLGDGGLVISLITNVSHGSLSLQSDGIFNYTGDLEFNGSDSFTYLLKDANGDIDNASVSIIINPVDDLVDAIDDLYSVDEDMVLSGNVKDNDQNMGDGNITITLVSGVSQGTLALTSAGTFTYTPDADYNGPDSFIYEIEDDDGDKNQANVDITINSINDIPVAVVDNTGTQQNTAIEIPVLANDNSLGDGVQSVSIATSPTVDMGSAIVNPTNTITYTPKIGYTGTATFEYTVCDNDMECSTAAVSVVVDNIDDQPTAVADADITDEDIPVTIDVLANDGGLFDGGILVSIDTYPEYGTVHVNANNTITYTPNLDWYGLDQFTYRVCDVDNDCSTSDVVITVNPVNDYVPVAKDDSCATSINTQVIANVLINDYDLIDGGIIVSIETPPTSGSVNVVDNEIVFTPATDFTGVVSLIYKVCDRDSDCDFATLKVKVKTVNSTPLAFDDYDTTFVNNAIDINVLANDIGLDEGIGAVSIYSTPVNGSSIVNADFTINYTPNVDFTGNDSLLYKVEDVDGDFDIATLFIHVDSKPNYLPVANNDSCATSVNIPVNINVLNNDTGLDDGGTVVTINLAPNPLEGVVVVNGDKSITFTPAADYIGVSTFKYRVCDKDSECDIATVKVNVKETNSVPIANDDVTSTYQNESVLIHVLDNDRGLEDGINTLQIHSSPSNGSVIVNDDYTITYTPLNWYTGTDQFEYLIEDTDGDFAIATVHVEIVLKPNFIPTANSDERGTTMNTLVHVDVLTNDVGLEDGGIIVSVKSEPNPAEGSAFVNLENNNIEFTPATDFLGDVNFEYLVCDVDGDCDFAYVTIHVKEQNQVPLAVDDHVSVLMNATININVLKNDSGLEDGIREVSIKTNPVHGSVVVYGDNTIYYVPSKWFVGEDSLKYMVEDKDGDLSMAMVYIEVVPLVNNIPVANDDYRGTSKNTEVIVDVLFNDTGLEDDGLNLTIDNIPTNGSAIINVDNTITYTPDKDYIGADVFEYHVCDVDGDCSASARVTINVKEVNLLPQAFDDEASTFMNTSVTINVLANDTKLFDGIKSLNIFSNPSNGSVIVNADRTVTYTPSNWYIGTDQFEYWVEDVDGDYSIASVTVTITEEQDHKPLAKNDARGTKINTSVIVDVLVNDSGLEDEGIVVTKMSDPSNGLLTVNVDNTITYTPNTEFEGMDQFNYQVCDINGDCSSAKVTITVKHENVIPSAVNDSVTIYMNIPQIIQVLSNDYGLEDGLKKISLYKKPVNGNVTINEDNTVTYTPAWWYVGTDQFDYWIEDVDGDYSIASVYVTITEEPDYIPVANDDRCATIMNNPVNVDVLINDTGLEDGGLVLTVKTLPSNGTVNLEIDNTITYMPNADYLGMDEFSYQVCDMDGDCSTAIVTIHVKETNVVPVANDDDATTTMNTAVMIDVLNNDLGLEDGLKEVSIFAFPLHGEIVVNLDNTISYTPHAWYKGPDSFDYVITDLDGDYDIATVTISITSVPDYIPVANNDSRGTTLNTDVNIDVLINDTGLEDGGLVLSVTSDPSNGAYTINIDNTITYSPNNNYLGTDQFEYQVCDADGDCSTASVTINVKESNNVPVAIDDHATTIMNTEVSLDVLSNDTGLEDGILDLIEFSRPTHGNVVINADYSITYIPNNWYVGNDSFEYMVHDVDGDYSIARVTITINEVSNHIPVANNDSRGTSINTDVVVDVLINDTGLEDGGLILTVTSDPSNGTFVVNEDNTITYSPNTDYLGTDQFIYQVCDADGDCSSATVTITVKVNNKVPLAVDDEATTVMNKELKVAVLNNDTGLSDGGISVNAFNDPSHGTVVVHEDNTITYIPHNWYVGTDRFKYMVSDVDGDYSIANVDITIDPRPNYIPDANDDARGTSKNTAVMVDVLTNDTGLDDGGLVLSITTNPSNGNAIVNADHSITYSPVNNYLGTDHFDYQVCDIDGDCSSATVTITVREENTIPVAINDKVYTNMDTNVLIDILENDSGLDDGGIVITLDSEVTHGSVSINSDHTITYSPNTGFEGTGSFSYRVTDVDGDYDVAEVEIIVMSGTLPGIFVSSISGNTEENGTKASFTIKLNTEPTSDVYIDLHSNDLTEGTISDTRLTFTSSDWDYAQTVTVTGINDDVDDDDISYIIILDNAVSSDLIYQGLNINNIHLTNIDDDVAGVSVITTENQTSEDQTSAMFKVVLNSEPLEDVSIDLLSDDNTEGVLEIMNIVFTPENWADTISVVVNGLDDDEVDGDVTYHVLLSSVVSADVKYMDIDPDDVTLVNIDNDSRELIIPEAFSPGNDGFNDYFEIVNLEHHDKATIRIYNRWGSLVYSNDHYQNNWDGKSNVGSTIGSELPMGTYYYILEISDMSKKISGYVFIKR